MVVKIRNTSHPTWSWREYNQIHRWYHYTYSRSHNSQTHLQHCSLNPKFKIHARRHLQLQLEWSYGQIIWNFHWKLSHMELFNNTNLKKKHRKFFYIRKSQKACMDFPNQSISPTINWSSILPNLAMIQHPPLPDCSGTKHGPFNFHWQWMILVHSEITKMISPICYTQKKSKIYLRNSK